MTFWLAATAVMLFCVALCGAVCFRGGTLSRLAGLEAASTIGALLLLIYAEATTTDYLADLGLALALLSFGGGLVFARFIERWM